MTAVADAIRERAGTSEPLVFPEGFVSAVEGIPDLLEQSLTDTLIEYSNSNIAEFKSSYTFYKRTRLSFVDLPKLTYVPNWCFASCPHLEIVNLPSIHTIADNGLYGTPISKLDCPKLANIRDGALGSCNNLTALILKVDDVARLTNVSALQNTPIANGTGFIYVPRHLVNRYKKETNWLNFANQIRAIDDYPEITGGAV